MSKLHVNEINAKGSDVTAMSIDTAGRVLTPALPVFFAEKTATFNSTSSYQEIVYDTAHINQGNCYSTSTGRFTAPISGIYEFGYGHIATAADNVHRMHLKKNGSYITIGGVAKHYELRHQIMDDDYQCNAQYVVYVSLTASDYVSTWWKTDNNDDSMYASANPVYNVFRGRLIG